MDGISIVRQNRDQQRLANIVDVTIDGRDDDAAFRIPLLFFEVLLEVTDGALHDLGALEYERQDQFTCAEAVTDVLHRG